MAATWITLEPKIINKPHTTQIQGIDVSITLPPYDVPTRARCSGRDSDGNLTFEFRYASDNDEDKSRVNKDAIKLDVGKKTKRVYRLEISSETVDALIDSRRGADSRLVYALWGEHDSIDAYDPEQRKLEAARNVIQAYGKELRTAC